jgi:seryl-tRNA synthetase
MANPNDTLKTAIKAWEKVCPEDVTDVSDIRKSKSASDALERELTTAKIQYKRKSSEYEDFTDKDIATLLKKVKAYQKELKECESDLAQLKKWLAKVRTSNDPLPFALVVKGSDKGSLHVFKTEGRVDRSARAGKQDISGSKIHDGTCTYTGGKLVFMFEDGSRAPWKSLLQNIINQAGVNMKVKLGNVADDSEQSPSK